MSVRLSFCQSCFGGGGGGGGLPRETGRVDRKEGVRWNAWGEIVSRATPGHPASIIVKLHTYTSWSIVNKQTDKRREKLVGEAQFESVKCNMMLCRSIADKQTNAGIYILCGLKRVLTNGYISPPPHTPLFSEWCSRLCKDGNDTYTCDCAPGYEHDSCDTGERNHVVSCFKQC